MTATRVAVIDHAFAVRAAQWPEIFASLLDRAARRAERLVVLQAIAHLTRVDDRLLALLWCLAERWGRVAPDGVLVSLRLSHRTLAAMVGARRPSVTTALGQLMARGELERRAEGEWILLGNAPEATDAGRAAWLGSSGSDARTIDYKPRSAGIKGAWTTPAHRANVTRSRRGS